MSKSAVERRLERLRKSKGLSKRQFFSFSGNGKLSENVYIPDIDHGAWSYIGEPTAPDFKEYSFL